MTPEEEKYLKESGTCAACGHLDVLHSTHCCEFCKVPKCLCRWGSIDVPENEQTTKGDK